MNNDLLKLKLIELQQNYKNILYKVSDNLKKSFSPVVLDELNIFWYKNKDFVESVLRYLYKPYTAYIFSGASILDIDNFEHYPFMLLGNYHIFDDKISMYAQTVGFFSNKKFDEHTKEQTINLISDNINIIENYSDICLLPVTLLFGHEPEYKDIADKIFLSLFKDNIDIDFYHKSFKTISDIKIGLKEGTESYIILGKNDELSDDLELRFEHFKKEMIFPFSENTNDAFLFYFNFYSNIMHVLSIFFTSFKYKYIPYIRCEVTAMYMIVLRHIYSHLFDSEETLNIFIKSKIAYSIHEIFDKEKIKDIDFRKYVSLIKESSFEDIIFNKLKNKSIDIFLASKDDIREVIEYCLSKHVYEKL